MCRVALAEVHVDFQLLTMRTAMGSGAISILPLSVICSPGPGALRSGLEVAITAICRQVLEFTNEA